MQRKNMIFGTGQIRQNSTALEIAIDSFENVIANEMRAFLCSFNSSPSLIRYSVGINARLPAW